MTNRAEWARDLDRAERLREAASAYDEAIGTGKYDEDILLDAAFVHLDLFDLGSNDLDELDLRQVEYHGNRMFALLDRAFEEYPENLQVRFWYEYFRDIYGFALMDREHWVHIVTTGQWHVPVIAFPVGFLSERLRAYAQEAMRDIRSESERTARDKYVLSILSGFV